MGVKVVGPDSFEAGALGLHGQPDHVGDAEGPDAEAQRDGRQMVVMTLRRVARLGYSTRNKCSGSTDMAAVCIVTCIGVLAGGTSPGTPVPRGSRMRRRLDNPPGAE